MHNFVTKRNRSLTKAIHNILEGVVNLFKSIYLNGIDEIDRSDLSGSAMIICFY